MCVCVCCFSNVVLWWLLFFSVKDNILHFKLLCVHMRPHSCTVCLITGAWSSKQAGKGPPNICDQGSVTWWPSHGTWVSLIWKLLKISPSLLFNSLHLMTPYLTDTSWLKSYFQERAKRVACSQSSATPVYCLRECWLENRTCKDWISLSSSRHVPETFSPSTPHDCQKPTSPHPYVL